MNVQHIEIVFENCESMKLLYPDVCYLDITGIEDSYNSYVNAISLNKCASNFTLGIKCSAKPELHSFIEKADPLSRLLNDITQLVVSFDDDTSILYLIKWPNDGNEFYHSGQEIVRTKRGNVLVRSRVNPKDLLSENDLEDLKEHIDYLCDVSRL